MEMTLINQLSAGVCRGMMETGSQRANPTVNHACSLRAAPWSSPRLLCSLHAAVGALLPGTCKSFKKQMGERGKPDTRRFMLTSSGVQNMRSRKACTYLHKLWCCTDLIF